MGTEQAVEAAPAQRAEHRGDVTVRQRAGHAQGLLVGRDHGATFEQGAQSFDQLAWPGAQVEQRALPDLAAVAVGLPQQDRGRRAAVRHSLDVHGRMICHEIAEIKKHNLDYMATLRWIAADICGKIKSLDPAEVGSSA